MRGRGPDMRLLAIGALAALLLIVAAPAGAQYPPAEEGLTCARSTVEPGMEIDCEAGGFEPNSEVGIFFDGKKVATVKADADGNVDFDFTVPKDASIGDHTLELRGEDPEGDARVLSFDLEVVKDIAKTGAGISLGVVVGAGAALVLGVALVVVTRSRRPGTPV